MTNNEYYKKPKGVRTDNYIKLGSDGTGSKWINFLNNETSSNLDQDFVGSMLFKISNYHFYYYILDVLNDLK